MLLPYRGDIDDAGGAGKAGCRDRVSDIVFQYSAFTGNSGRLAETADVYFLNMRDPAAGITDIDPYPEQTDR